MLRYIERVIGIDLQDIKDKIVNENDKTYIKTFGNCKINKEGFKVVVRDNVVVTVE